MKKLVSIAVSLLLIFALVSCDLGTPPHSAAPDGNKNESSSGTTNSGGTGHGTQST